MNVVKRLFRRLGSKMVNRNLSTLHDHSELKNLDLRMTDLVKEWKRMYEGGSSKLTYTTAVGKRSRVRKTLNMPKVLTSQMASLIFNEGCSVNVSDVDTNKYIQGVLNDNKFYKVFQGYLEYMFALGGLIIKPYYDFETKKIKLSYVTADSYIILSKRNGQIEDIVFINDLKIDKLNYTHLEFHLKRDGARVIRNELYRAKGNSLERVSLSVLNKEFGKGQGLEDQVKVEDFKHSLFVHIKPNIANNFRIQNVEGISLFANSIDTLDSIDSAYDSLMNEFRLGKKRIFVSSDLIKEVIDPATGDSHRYFDSNDEVYEVFNKGTGDGELFKEVEMELRVDEHISALNALLDIVSEQTGFNVGTYTVNKSSVKTATEVISENSKTFKSKRSHEMIVEEGLIELVNVILELSEYYDVYSNRGSKDLETVVKFDDSIVEDFSTDIDQQVLMLTNGVQTRLNSIMKLHKVTEEEAKRMLKEIDEDRLDEKSPNLIKA